MSVDISAYLNQQKTLCHCFSPDGKYVAVSLKQLNAIEIFSYEEIHQLKKWKPVWRIKDQSMQIATLEWSSQNKILAGSYDRSIFVYKLNNTKWEKDIVICENEKAVLCGQWNPTGTKFAIGTACHHAYIGYYEEKVQWWQTAKIGSLKSSVIAVQWHPSSKVIAIGSCDFSVQLYTAALQKENSDNYELIEKTSFDGVYSSKNSFNEMIFAIKNTNGWVEALAFTPTGDKLVMSVHNGQLKYFEITDEEVIEGQELFSDSLPFSQLLFKDDKTLVAAGYDQKPVVFEVSDKLKRVGFVEKNLMTGQSSGLGGTKSLMAKFEQRCIKTANQNIKDTSQHTTSILCLRQAPQGLVSTNDINGKINFWKI